MCSCTGSPITWKAVDRLAPVLFVSRINAHPHLLYLILPSLILLVYRRGSFWTPANITNAAFIGSAVLHMQFASTGWFYRYEAYVMCFGIYAVAAGLADHLPGRDGWQGFGKLAFPRRGGAPAGDPGQLPFARCGQLNR